MRIPGQIGAHFIKKRPCGGFGHAIGSDGRSVSISLDCGRWDCPDCGKVLAKTWMRRVTKAIPGAVLYTARTRLTKRALSERIRRNLDKEQSYFCVHLDDEAFIFSNAKFRGAAPKNRKKFLGEIKVLMGTGKVKGVSRRQLNNNVMKPERGAPWCFARITKEIKREYDQCASDYEIGMLILKYIGTDEIRSVTKLGKELLRKIKTGEITAPACGTQLEVVQVNEGTPSRQKPFADPGKHAPQLQ